MSKIKWQSKPFEKTLNNLMNEYFIQQIITKQFNSETAHKTRRKDTRKTIRVITVNIYKRMLADF